jgi:hypothetical protein
MHKEFVTYNIKTSLAFLVLCGFGSVFIQFYPRILEIIIVIVSLLLYTLNNGVITKKMLAIVGVICCCCVIHCAITSKLFYYYAGIIVKILIIMFFVSAYRCDFQDIKFHLMRATKFVTILATINIFVPLLFPNMFVLQSKENGYIVNTLGFIFNYVSTYNVGGIIFFRNQGLYWEPGVLQAVINIYIYYLLIEQKQNINKVKLPIFVVLSTFSTTGYILLALMLLYSLIKRKRSSGFDLSLLLVLLLFTSILTSQIAYKFKGEGKESSSTRVTDIIIGIKIIMKHPYIGLGYHPQKYDEEVKILLKENQTLHTTNHGNTNSIMQMFYYFGIPLGILLFRALYKQKIFHNSNFFFIMIFIILCAEPLLMSHFTTLLLMSSCWNNKI